MALACASTTDCSAGLLNRTGTQNVAPLKGIHRQAKVDPPIQTSPPENHFLKVRVAYERNPSNRCLDPALDRGSFGASQSFGLSFFLWPAIQLCFHIMLWVDKHRPSKLEDLSYHPDISNRLGSMAQNPETMPHLLFYGPSGAGKKTRITALLRELYGPSAERIKLDKRVFTTPTKRQVEITLITSNHHIELSPGDAGLNDRFIVQDIIKEMASNKNIASSLSNKASGKKTAFKVVVLTEVDQLSRQAQAALRRTMEKYTSTCRLILCCNSQSKVIEPVRSRCLGIRVACPTEDQVRFSSFGTLPRRSLIFFLVDMHCTEKGCCSRNNHSAGSIGRQHCP